MPAIVPKVIAEKLGLVEDAVAKLPELDIGPVPSCAAQGTQPGNAAACFTQVAIWASSSSSPSRMSR